MVQGQQIGPKADVSHKTLGFIAACDERQGEHDGNQSWQQAVENIFVRALIKLSAGILEQMQSI